MPPFYVGNLLGHAGSKMPQHALPPEGGPRPSPSMPRTQLLWNFPATSPTTNEPHRAPERRKLSHTRRNATQC
eukprot:1595045-Alexandrium_andersonii.AAC.1